MALEPTDGQAQTPRQVIRSSLPDIFNAATSGAIGAVVPGAAGSLLGALVPAAVALAYSVDRASQKRREERAAQALLTAADVLGENLQELEERITATDERTDLASAVLRAAAMTITAEDKIEALGRTLAHGLQDDDQFDPAVALAAALRDVEKPHIAALRKLVTAYQQPLKYDERGRVTAWSPSFMRVHGDRELASVAGGELTLPVVMATLTRHGLVKTQQIQERYRDPREGWALTYLGQLFLHMLDPVTYPKVTGPSMATISPLGGVEEESIPSAPSQELDPLGQGADDRQGESANAL